MRELCKQPFFTPQDPYYLSLVSMALRENGREEANRLKRENEKCNNQ